MRDYFSQKESIRKNSLLKIAILISISLLSAVLMLFIFSWLISNTGISEKYESLIMIAITALLSIAITAILVLCTELKGIYCSLIAFALLILFKLLLNMVLSVPVSLGKQGILGIIFSLVFCITGGLITSNAKK